ncbi:Undecaprenyl-phosphate galactose phosphotransferase, WbaP/exopolysaccharide biosynthesis polyprenyl glycosylphosphotransferase [Agreia bicolorata]|uniref:Undecaprenyl-phosphate galactose phosphotransferase, WbaP/exopolysaccharide biosynthesis polyprenyl glycosylphosphotransferase n=1 Tax=Agreia bicolorata TaxID=110935 RepID=A0A1T4WXW6_9MICO|nr:sugar transferase [Agreia bicolorata]SKA82190.1 Undecaprenyl-phosphate galactose phosphotransferase, WbaP/exopolysaccharide biosynthesis polyprenyl glycosylphosphotransferase [Agreia bicolorata]
MIEQQAESETGRATRKVLNDWRQRYAYSLMFTDLLVLIWVIVGVQIAWFGVTTSAVTFSGSLSDVAISYSLTSLILIVAWMLMLGIFGTRSYRVLGTGTQEYRLIADASVRLFGLVAIVAFLFKIDFARGYILLAFPLGVIVLLFSRWIWRQWLGVQRQQGEYSSRVLLVGSEASTAYLANELARLPTAGYYVVGACIPNGTVAGYLRETGVPVFVSIDRLQDAMAESRADTVVITSSEELSAEKIRQISWSLEPGRQHLVVAPSLTDIGGPRIHTRPVAGLPLIHVETPRYTGAKQFTKRAFDVAASSILLIVLSPVLGILALTVRLSSTGPALFRQERVGINGTRFQMLKFRSMVTNAEEMLEQLRLHSRSADKGNSVLFKMSDDPRVTAIGRVLRRFSLDELPQLFNVFAGSMSLVGPRPPLEREVDQYDKHVHRRFLVKPGITGLWQVSGRSNLSWEDTVRLDLYYVENWSITGDIVILWRTVKATLGKDGAY